MNTKFQIETFLNEGNLRNCIKMHWELTIDHELLIGKLLRRQ